MMRSFDESSRLHWLYVGTALLSLAACFIAECADVWHSVDLPVSDFHSVNFKGYSDAWNWLSLPAIIALGIFAVDKALSELTGTSKRPAPLVQVAFGDENKRLVAQRLDKLRHSSVILKVGALCLVLNILDVSGTLRILMFPTMDKSQTTKDQVLLVCGVPLHMTNGEAFAPHGYKGLKNSGTNQDEYSSQEARTPSCDDPALATAIREPDWTVMALGRDRTNAGLANTYLRSQLLVIFIAYVQQFIASFLGIWLIWICACHNWIYLTSITRNKPGVKRPAGLIRLNFFDHNKMFGFVELQRPFSLIVRMCILSGVAVLLSRWTNSHRSIDLPAASNPDAGIAVFTELVWRSAFADIGQIILIAGFLFLLGVSLVPALAKALPLLVGARTANESFQVLMPSGDWSPSQGVMGSSWPDDEATQKIFLEEAKKNFRNQSFWPLGTTSAQFFFSVVFYVSFNIFLPAFSLGFIVETLVIQMVFALGAYTLSVVFLKIVNAIENWTLRETAPR